MKKRVNDDDHGSLRGHFTMASQRKNICQKLRGITKQHCFISNQSKWVRNGNYYVIVPIYQHQTYIMSCG